MKKVIFLLLLCVLCLSCLKNTEENIDENYAEIHLKWNKSYKEDTIEKATTGLYWCYSMISAKVLSTAVVQLKDTIFTVNINNIALDKIALQKLKKLHKKIIKTQAYQQENFIDLGRYIALLVGASEHYYAFTNIPEDLDDILVNYKLHPFRGYVNNSSVSLKHRIIEYSKQENAKQLFLSSEFDSITNKIIEYETLELMENGQLKFGVFNADKKRINAANAKHTNAGKPAKCIWCHESNINQLFTPQKDFTGFLKSLHLNDTLIEYNKKLKKQQQLLTTGVNFNNKQEHTQLELAYITFMEPSLLRLSNEWNMSKVEIKEILKKLPTHQHKEFPFLGVLYHRKDVEKFSAYKNLKVSSSVRETSKIEVNYID